MKGSRPAGRKRARGRKSVPQRGAAPPRELTGRAVRLNKWLSDQGVASRRKADELIAAGSVEVNGEVVTALGRRISAGDRVCVNGEPVKKLRRLYYVFNKPAGVLCTDDPREARPRVRDLIEGQVAGRVYPIGRLDEESEGLLILTNDGDFANLVAHPRYGVPKTYIARVQGTLPRADAEKLRQGVHLAGGKAVPESLRVLKRTRQSTTVRVVLREGRNRELRRMFAKLGHGVKSLKRVQIGPVRLQGVPRGQVRPLRKAERDGMLALVAREAARPPGPEDRRRAPASRRRHSR